MKHPSRGLIGRDRELSEADEALDTAASGTPQVLLGGGDAGIGKTRVSDKTVSVHVTNLLAKLGVTNRTEAAGLAKDLAVAE